jgi:hypothetical protein
VQLANWFINMQNCGHGKKKTWMERLWCARC